MVSSTSFKRCRSYFVGTFSGDTLSGDTSCRVQRGKRHFAGQIILFMCLNLFFLPPPHNYSLLCRLLRWMTLGYAATFGLVSTDDDREHAFDQLSLEASRFACTSCQQLDRKSTRLNSSHALTSRMPSSA